MIKNCFETICIALRQLPFHLEVFRLEEKENYEDHL